MPCVEKGAKQIDDCLCDEGFFGFNATCIKCPSICECYGKVISSCYLPPSISIHSLPEATPEPCPQYLV